MEVPFVKKREKELAGQGDKGEINYFIIDINKL
jgi:hypothetical protein